MAASSVRSFCSSFERSSDWVSTGFLASWGGSLAGVSGAVDQRERRARADPEGGAPPSIGSALPPEIPALAGRCNTGASGRGTTRTVAARETHLQFTGPPHEAVRRLRPVDSGTVLSARQLAKRFGRVRAVDGIDLDVAAGERVALLGPNGAGKTTTLLMLLGAITPDDGTIDILGHAVPKRRSKAMAEVGFVAGYLPLPDRLKVREALELFAGFYGLAGAVARDAVTRGLDRFRLGHLADRPCMELSSGQRTLVGIAKSTLHHPRLLVLDEPTASLDPDVADRVRTALLDINAEEGTALLVTSHNMLEVELLCERVVFVNAGRVVADGAPAEVAARYGHGGLEGVFLHLAREGGEP